MKMANDSQCVLRNSHVLLLLNMHYIKVQVEGPLLLNVGHNTKFDNAAKKRNNARINS